MQAAAQLPPPVLPPPVRRGDRVGVAALSGPAKPERVEAGLDALAGLGFDPVPAANLRRSHGLFAGSDDERLDAFHALADDPSLRAVFFVRGGWGALRVLPRVDWARLARRPLAWVGYSDLTPFLAAVVQRLGLVAFHGPMVAADMARGLSGEEADSLAAALAGDWPRQLPVEMDEEARSAAAVEGPLAGGCLSLLVSTLGTGWASRLDGSILFVEDVDEPLYRLDRMLTHLGLSGSLAAVRAMIFGHLGCTDPPSAAVLPAPLRETLADLPGPLAWGLPAGHAAPNMTLPIGLNCRLEPAAGRLLLGLPAAEAAG